MRTIRLFAVDKVAHLVQPDEFHELSLSSPALTIFTDFKSHRPLTIEGATPAIEVENMMRKAHVKMKLVVDADNEFIGTISLDDLDEQHFMTMIANGHERGEILTSDLMTSKQKIMALNLAELEQANINDVIRALRESGQQHCLVVDYSGQQIRGLISAGDCTFRFASNAYPHLAIFFLP